MFSQIKKNGLVVSCQAEGNDPFNSPEGVVLFAKAAEMAGASAIRSEGVEKTKKIVSEIKLPVIGLIKSNYPDGSVKITGSIREVEELISIGCSIIAIDGTFRKRDGLSGPDFISGVKEKYKIHVMADISSLEEAVSCENAGTDFVSSTLNGYTPETKSDNNGAPNFKLVKELVTKLKIPVFAEGRISTPEQAEQMLGLGANAVVVGTAITRPRLITQQFINLINQSFK